MRLRKKRKAYAYAVEREVQRLENAGKREKGEAKQLSLNQEKIMKAKMITITFVLRHLQGCSFLSGFMDKSEEARKTYIVKYMENLSAALRDRHYLESCKDLPTRYNMILSDGAARSLVFLIDDYNR